MHILILGSGGREHTLAWKIKQSPKCTQLSIAPGNAGTESCGENVNLPLNDFSAIASFCKSNNVDMLVVGPEAPLVDGIVDYLRSDGSMNHLQIIGPTQQGALLEGSKKYAKEFMQEFGIPTASYRSFNRGMLEEGNSFIDDLQPPIVLKADGLAAGKGVLICGNKEEAKAELKEMLDGKFGAASNEVVIEDFLKGIEFSVFVLTDGENYKILPVAKDYKRIGEGDTGLNTGGMGCVSPPPFVDAELMDKVEERIIRPTVNGLKERKIDYQGFVFFGLISVGNDPYVIEYNCRLGDPETEVILPRLKNDLLELLESLKTKKLNEQKIEISEDVAATVMLVSGGYPGDYPKGIEISGLERIQNSEIFHAGTTISGGKLVTNGGRVIAVTSFGKDFKSAVRISNNIAENIHFDGKYYRTDIGFDL